MPLISVIVPVYNVEDYLHQCIESIVNQSFADFELILVDDGSTDASSYICDKEAECDERIVVIHKTNEGVSATRNTGIECAQSKWIAFIDSDDTVKSDYLEKLFQKAQQSDCDLITSGLIYDYGDRLEESPLEETTVKSFDREADFLYMITQELITSPVGKLYKRDIIIDKELRFDPLLSFGEDRDFNICYLNAIKSACSTSYVGYYYRIYVSCSLTKREHPKRYENDYKYWTKLKEFTQARNYISVSTEKMLTNRLFHLVSDKVMSIIEESISFSDRIDLLRDAFVLIDDFNYLTKRKTLIDGGNKLLKQLILHRHNLLLSLLSFLFNGKNEQSTSGNCCPNL